MKKLLGIFLTLFICIAMQAGDFTGCKKSISTRDTEAMMEPTTGILLQLIML